MSGLSLGRRRTGWAAAAAVAVGTAITIVAINGASASHAGDSVGLSATNGTKTISFKGGTPAALTLANDTVTDGAWSPDGSRMAFVNQNGALETVRYNNATDTGMYAEADGDARSRPTWTDDGSFLLWSRNITDTTGTHDIIEFGTGDKQGWGAINLDSGTNWTFPDGGAGSTILVQGQPTAGGVTSIYSIDETNLFDDTVTPTLVQSDASSPAASPIDNSVAYIASDGSHAQVWVKPGGGGAAVQVTSDAVDHSNPTWSPDGKTIAFDEGTNVFTALADGSQKAAPVNANLTGVPAYQPTFQNVNIRFAGSNRYGTAINVSQGNWSDAGANNELLSANAVVLSRGDTFADALGGSALAAAKQGPLLLTPPTSLWPATATEIKRVLGSDTSKTVYLVGGTGALSTSVENSVKALGYQTVRVFGSDRYGTAVAVAKAINPSPDLVLAATGLNFPDALSAGAAAGSFDVPGTGLSAVVVLTANNTMPSATNSYLTGLEAGANPPVIAAIGGSAATALGTATACQPATAACFGIVGSNRYDTARQVADFFFAGPQFYGVATGTDFPDALSGGALLASLGGPLLLAPPAAADPGVEDYIDKDSASLTFEAVFGGTAVLSASATNSYAKSMSGPDGTLNVPNLQHAGVDKSSAQALQMDVTPKTRAQKAATRQLPDFKNLPSYVEKIN